VNNNAKFDSWKSAARYVGLLFMIWERFFNVLSYLSPLVIFTRIIQKSQVSHTVEFSALWKDWYKLIFFLITGFIIPVWLMYGDGSLSPRIVLFWGIYVMVLVLQHHVNITLFNDFRTEHLYLPSQGGPLWQKLESIVKIILPLEVQSSHLKRYTITRGRRRIVLTLMDFWLLFVCFAEIYWAGIPDEFSPPIKHFFGALYMSIITGTTLGFGDITPITIRAQLITAGEVLFCFLFAFIIIADTVIVMPDFRKNNNDEKST
jgi:hypothetical protein